MTAVYVNGLSCFRILLRTARLASIPVASIQRAEKAIQLHFKEHLCLYYTFVFKYVKLSLYWEIKSVRRNIW